ncbi:GNAT family protein [Demequina capsici]|uniref:GNAT family protein n=1 Tax=Demequina capsici TaxID=3075620 RepID=A0AA96FDU6_9MICO|nr:MULTISPECIES: GNAT family protein [unclassified Demequina]WNM25603.1 GNAT family protein [Demequina sp. OYTSA14]WNM28509.1 GNAT family protein [Demequina sp. PMTSA13]
MTFADTPVLENSLVRLEPLSQEHHDDLCAATGSLPATAWYTTVPTPEQMAKEIERRLSLQFEGTMAPWAIVPVTTGRAVGMTTFMNLDQPNRRLEIGSTWMGPEAHGTGINPAAKLLLLTRAFDELGCIAVELRTHWHNHQSRAAIARLGAKQDGVLRNHQVWRDGTLRDTVVFSIIQHEWPAVRSGLEARIASHG